MTYKELSKLDKKRKLISEKITEGKTEEALVLIDELGTLIKEQKIKIVADENTKIKYSCSECGLTCEIVAQFELSDSVLNRCLQSEEETAVFREVDRVVNV